MLLWLKALHIIAVIWMAGLLYLPRLFVTVVKQSPDRTSGKADNNKRARFRKTKITDE
jgi:uncharacterized membrane protein